MKKVTVIGILFIGLIGFAQNPATPIDSISKFHFTFVDETVKFKANDISSLKNFDYSSKTNFSVYNPLTGFNDNYVKGRDSYFPIHSTMSKPNIWTGEKRDSFNPSGAANIGNAVIVGILNTIFQ